MSNSFLKRLEEMSEQSANDLHNLSVGLAFIPKQMSGIHRGMKFILEEALRHDAAVNQAIYAMKSGNYEGAVKALGNPTFN